MIDEYDVYEDESQLSDITERVEDGRRYIACTVYVPDDLYDGGESSDELRADYAIFVAREQLPDYCMPANWRIIWSNYDEVRVERESRV